MKFNDKIYEQKKIENFIMIDLFFLLTAAQLRQEDMTTGGAGPPFSSEKEERQNALIYKLIV